MHACMGLHRPTLSRSTGLARTYGGNGLEHRIRLRVDELNSFGAQQFHRHHQDEGCVVQTNECIPQPQTRLHGRAATQRSDDPLRGVELWPNALLLETRVQHGVVEAQELLEHGEEWRHSCVHIMGGFTLALWGTAREVQP